MFDRWNFTVCSVTQSIRASCRFEWPSATRARISRSRFVSEIFGDASYGQLKLTSDFRILERGPDDDQMGALGFLTEAHKWRNLQIRYREFMPVGVRPLLIPVT